jgi:hypothetical protein
LGSLAAGFLEVRRARGGLLGGAGSLAVGFLGARRALAGVLGRGTGAGVSRGIVAWDEVLWHTPIAVARVREIMVGTVMKTLLWVKCPTEAKHA